MMFLKKLMMMTMRCLSQKKNNPFVVVVEGCVLRYNVWIFLNIAESVMFYQQVT